MDKKRILGDPSSLPPESRRKMDVWTFGKLLSNLAKLEGDKNKLMLYQDVIKGTLNKDPRLSLDLNIIIAKLEQIAMPN